MGAPIDSQIGCRAVGRGFRCRRRGSLDCCAAWGTAGQAFGGNGRSWGFPRAAPSHPWSGSAPRSGRDHAERPGRNTGAWRRPRSDSVRGRAQSATGVVSGPGAPCRQNAGGAHATLATAGRCESARSSRLVWPNRPDSQAFALPGPCEPSEPVPRRGLRTGSQAAPHAEPFLSRHEPDGSTKSTAAPRSNPRGRCLFCPVFPRVCASAGVRCAGTAFAQRAPRV